MQSRLREWLTPTRVGYVAGVLALLLGTYAAVEYYRADLTLSHYDARAHIVVARRILDSLTPGWKQIGAVWLPLPHLLNALPVQIDWLYRTGLSAVAVSVVSYAVAVGAAGWLIARVTGSGAAALAGAAVLAFNPNVLYLQATPMTEPLLLGLTLLGIALLFHWVTAQTAFSARFAGLALAAACLTRYEAWPITFAALAVAWMALVRNGRAPAAAAAAVASTGRYPLAAILGFMLLSKITVGSWLVTGGFFNPTNAVAGQPFAVLQQIHEVLQTLVGHTIWVAWAGAAALLTIAVRRRDRSAILLCLALAAAVALPFYAFFQGHPLRVRYMVPLVSAVAVFAGCGIGFLGRASVPAAALLVVLTLKAAPPFDQEAPMIREAAWTLPTIIERRDLTDYLAGEYRGEKILCSMGSLAPYMQEASRAGLALRDFIHEGNYGIWEAALADPHLHAGWILVRASDTEGRDALLAASATNPNFYDGFVRDREIGSVTVYRRMDRQIGETRHRGTEH